MNVRTIPLELMCNKVLTPNSACADGWSLFGGNFYTRPDRLTKFGWKATDSAKKTLLESLPDEIDEVLRTDERKRGYNPGQ